MVSRFRIVLLSEKSMRSQKGGKIFEEVEISTEE